MKVVRDLFDRNCAIFTLLSETSLIISDDWQMRLEIPEAFWRHMLNQKQLASKNDQQFRTMHSRYSICAPDQSNSEFIMFIELLFAIGGSNAKPYSACNEFYNVQFQQICYKFLLSVRHHLQFQYHTINSEKLPAHSYI